MKYIYTPLPNERNNIQNNTKFYKALIKEISSRGGVEVWTENQQKCKQKIHRRNLNSQ